MPATAGSPRKSPRKSPKKGKGMKGKGMKPRGMKSPASHPKTADMVIEAINSMKDRKGSSLSAIKKYIAAHYKLDASRLAPLIRMAVKKGVATGTLKQVSGSGASGKFRMNSTSVVGKKGKKATTPGKKATTPTKVDKKQLRKSKAQKKAKKPKAQKKTKKPKAQKAEQKPQKAEKKGKKAKKQKKTRKGGKKSKKGRK